MKGFYSFPSQAHLRFGSEFANLKKKGRLYRTPHFLVYAQKNCLQNSRLGLTVSRRVGNAPQRNRVKRLLRECFRLYLQHENPGYDFSIIARSGAPELSFEQALRELTGCMRTGRS